MRSARLSNRAAGVPANLPTGFRRAGREHLPADQSFVMVCNIEHTWTPSFCLEPSPRRVIARFRPCRGRLFFSRLPRHGHLLICRHRTALRSREHGSEGLEVLSQLLRARAATSHPLP